MLADDLPKHIERLAGATGRDIPPETPLFGINWRNLLRAFNLDLAAAGTPERDIQGRTVDVHCLRHTFGTHLSKAGVAPRTAQAAMRHSSLDLTMNIYTDPRLLDVGAAVDALPAFDATMPPALTASNA